MEKAVKKGLKLSAFGAALFTSHQRYQRHGLKSSVSNRE
jgi:hypothetical protein